MSLLTKTRIKCIMLAIPKHALLSFPMSIGLYHRRPMLGTVVGIGNMICCCCCCCWDSARGCENQFMLSQHARRVWKMMFLCSISTRFGLVWFGLVWFGLVWFGVL